MTDQVARLSAALSGRYSIERELGEGGMATVYLAEDLKHDRKVAIKVLKTELAAVLGAERFLAEIKTTANLQHPHILPLYDSGEVGSFLFYVMPYVEGESLRERLRREKELSVEETVRIAKAVASALDFAHRRGVVHRDIKPANILLQDGQPLVADFGIALAVAQAGGGRLTETGMSLGTPHYMSPEQATADRDPDARSDVYSLACVVYEMLTGEPPHLGSSTQAVLARVLTETPRPVRDTRPTVPARVDAALAKALQKLPADRFDTAADFMAALEGKIVVETPGDGGIESVGAAAGATGATGTTAASRGALRRWLWPAVTVAALGLAGGLLWHRGAGTRVQALRVNIDLPAGVELEPPSSVEDAPRFALSPDGRSLVIVGVSGGQSRLYLRHFDQATARRIPGTDGARAPFFSPDGTWIGFWADGRIWKTSLVSGEKSVVCDAQEEVGAAWGRDGTILFGGGPQTGLLSVPDSGGKPSRLTTPDASRNEYAHVNPVFLPGGRVVLFEADLIGWTNQPQLREVEVLNLETGKWHELVDGAGTPRYLAAGWLTVEAGGGIERARFNAETARLTGPLEPLDLSGTAQAPTARSLSYDVAGLRGNLVYSASTLAGAGLYWLHHDGAKALVSPDHREGWHPMLSPDGQRLAINDAIGAEISEIWVLDVAGDSWQRLTSGANDWEPIWLHDGKSLAYAEARGGNTQIWDLFEIPADGSGSPRRVATYRHQSSSLALSPDAKSILWDDTRGEVWLQQTDSDVPPRQFLSSGSVTPEAFSPDGRWVVYSASNGGEDQVYVTDFPGARHRYLISRDGGDWPTWSRDGRDIYYRSGRSIFSVRVHRGEPFSVEKPRLLVKADFDYFFYDVSADESKIVVSATGSEKSKSASLVFIPHALSLLKGK